MQDIRKAIVSNIIALADIVAMLIAYVIANKVKFGWWRTGIRNPDTAYLTLFLIISVSYLFIEIFIPKRTLIINRSLVRDLLNVFQTHLYIAAVVVSYLYITKTSESYSRGHMVIFFIISMLLMFIEREIIKQYLIGYFRKTGKEEKVALITTSKNVEETMQMIMHKQNWYMKINEMIILDKDMIDERISGVYVVGNAKNFVEKLSVSENDSIYFCLDAKEEAEYFEGNMQETLQLFCDMGKKVYIGIEKLKLTGGESSIAYVGSNAVVSYGLRGRSVAARAVKRLLDLILALIGMIWFFIVFVLVEIGHLLEGDIGHVIFSHPRVGRNGRRFYLYRFRTMYLKDARRRKNPYSFTGRILRFLHLEELPSVWNIFWGDMSLIGTKAPTLPEYLSFDPMRRSTLREKPGIWCYNNRSFVQSDEALDLFYMERWSPWFDVKIFFQTLLFQNASRYRKESEEEEWISIAQLVWDENPYIYDGMEEKTKRKPILCLVKRLFDIVISLVGLVVLSPILIYLAIRIKWQDGGNIFYRQIRVTRKGKKFYLLKFRTMQMQIRNLKKLLTPEQYEQYKREFKINEDPRITKFGAFLRRSSLDELPQLWNVLKGEMSLIGPRPLVEKELEYFGEDVKTLLNVKPGMTGYWAVYGRNDVTYESGKRQELELYYANHQSIWLDIKILLRTIPTVIKKKGAR